MTPSVSHAAVCWPAERFYWARLDTPGPRHPGPIPPGLLPDLEELIPAPLDDLHIIAADARDGTLVCAIPAAELDSARDLMSLTPASLPPGLAGVDPLRLNFLVGRFEPQARRARRSRSRSLAILGMGIGFLTLALGLHRRTVQANASVRDAHAALHELQSKVGPFPHAGALEAENTRLRGLAESRARQSLPPDARPVLADLLARWPTSLGAEVLSMTVTGEEAILSTRVKGDPAALAAAIEAPEGWRRLEPRFSGVGDAARAVVTLRKEGRP